MGRTRIKICGVSDAETARAAADHGADAIGLAFVASSPRAVDEATAERVIGALAPFVTPVGLFADAEPETIRATAQRIGVAAVQLHGGETPETARALAPLRVVKALPCDDRLEAALAAWRGLDNLAGLLIDAPPPAGADRAGGHGRAYDAAALARRLPGEAPPVVLAGGLTAENVGHAIGAARPFGVDVSSGVEARRGVKDPERIGAFCAAVREADVTARGRA